MRALEAVVFLSLAAAVHVGFWSLGRGPDGAASAGGAGQQRVTIAAATQAQTELVERWSRPPGTASEMTALPEMPAVADTQAPRLPQSGLQPSVLEPSIALLEPRSESSLPSVDLTSPPPTVPTEEQTELKRPKLRPASLEQTATPIPRKITRQKQTAKGTSQQSQQGNKGRSDVNSRTASATNALRAQWGSGIYAQVRRHMHFPRGVTEGGTAKLALRIASNGKLRDLRLTRSSGNAVLDRAALRAVSRAGRFEKAPKGLPGDSHDFSLSLTFSR